MAVGVQRHCDSG